MEIKNAGYNHPQRLESWLSLKTPPGACREIRRRMQADIDGGKTGFCPYIQEGDIFFPAEMGFDYGKEEALGGTDIWKSGAVRFFFGQHIK